MIFIMIRCGYIEVSVRLVKGAKPLSQGTEDVVLDSKTVEQSV